VSIFGIFVAIGGAVAMLAAGHWIPVWAGLLMGAAGVQLRLLCNLMDGLVAIEGGLKSKAGDLFNEAPDRVEDTVLLVAAGYAAGHGELGWVCATLAMCAAYVRALGASLGLGQDYRGPGAKPHRMAMLTVGLLSAAACSAFSVEFPALKVALWAIVLLTGITIIRRTVRIYQRLP
jgi:phosphatidylglycerophosphate synthase